MNCPICEKEMTESRDTLDGWCLLEESYQCPNSCYEFIYCTGLTETIVKGESFSWYHTTPRGEIEEIENKIEAAVKKAKEAAANPA